MRHVWALAIAASALVTTAACATADGAGPSPAPYASSASTSAVGDAVFLGDNHGGRDRTASRTVSDWVTHADHVLVITAVDEIRQSPSREEIERGEGMIGRIVKLRVDKLLWSATDAPQPAPAILELAVAGWIFNNDNGSGTRTFALRDHSRIETGHTYVKAIEWIDDPCSDDPNKGKWDGLGSGDVIPFDAGVLGAGEFEGRVRTLDEAEAEVRDLGSVEPSARDQMVGEPIDTLVAALRAASPEAETGWQSECNPYDQ